MAYGFEIKNKDGRVIIDENYSNFFVGNASEQYTSVAAGAAYPPSGYLPGSLVLARTPIGTDGYVSRAPKLFSAPYTYTKFEFACDYYVVNPFDTVTPATSGYGMEIYDGSGNIRFSATSNNKVFEIVAIGEIPSSDTTTTRLYYPSSTASLGNLSNYFVVINTTLSWAFFGIRTHVDYYYEWTGTNSGRIQLVRSRQAGLNPEQPVGLTLYYMIMRLRG